MIICPSCGFRCGDADTKCPNCGYDFAQSFGGNGYSYSGTTAGRIWSVETSQLLATILTIAFVAGAFWLVYIFTGISPSDIIAGIGNVISSYYNSL